MARPKIGPFCSTLGHHVDTRGHGSPCADAMRRHQADMCWSTARNMWRRRRRPGPGRGQATSRPKSWCSSTSGPRRRTARRALPALRRTGSERLALYHDALAPIAPAHYQAGFRVEAVHALAVSLDALATQQRVQTPVVEAAPFLHPIPAAVAEGLRSQGARALRSARPIGTARAARRPCVRR